MPVVDEPGTDSDLDVTRTHDSLLCSELLIDSALGIDRYDLLVPQHVQQRRRNEAAIDPMLRLTERQDPPGCAIGVRQAVGVRRSRPTKSGEEPKLACRTGSARSYTSKVHPADSTTSRTHRNVAATFRVLKFIFGLTATTVTPRITEQQIIWDVSAQITAYARAELKRLRDTAITLGAKSANSARVPSRRDSSPDMASLRGGVVQPGIVPLSPVYRNARYGSADPRASSVAQSSGIASCSLPRRTRTSV